ncbi:ATP-sensitive inward rectifier potassium channel 8-like [Phlebotomus papatasi]|uniref:ATP-sensitive inward rectifier potassium channel 8-like n=1 Tax=Phlebotomus papatasi TaxID=29031 RepID=UPI002483449E|nr:ATP-sensitive inward rectifier potassium channel 8-like [Phlebotomus papatasi]
MFSKKSNRIYDKSGGKNIKQRNVSEKSAKFLKDFATTLIEGRWRYTLVAFTATFVVSWTIFAVLWMLVAQAHGDLDFDPATGERLSDGKSTCTHGAEDFAGFFLLSVEAQVTTGYGEKYPSEDCPEALFLLMIQILISVVIEGAMIGVVYAKLTRPPRHCGDLVFTRNCVICLRDGVLYLLFRISNFAQHQEISSRVEVFLCEKSIPFEGETENHKLELLNDGKITLFLPHDVSHPITEGSPLYGYSAADLLQANFEILVTLTGSSKATGQITQTRTSYLPSEILWGYRFKNIVHYDHGLETYVIESDKFNSVTRVDTPLCSAKYLRHVNETLCSTKDSNLRRRHRKDHQDTEKMCCSKYSLQMDMPIAEISLDSVFKESKKSPDEVVSQFETQSWDGFFDTPSNDNDIAF